MAQGHGGFQRDAGLDVSGEPSKPRFVPTTSLSAWKGVRTAGCIMDNHSQDFRPLNPHILAVFFKHVFFGGDESHFRSAQTMTHTQVGLSQQVFGHFWWQHIHCVAKHCNFTLKFMAGKN